MDNSRIEQLELILSHNQDQIYSALGYNLEKDTLELSPKPMSELLKIGKEWVNSQWENIKMKICSNKQIQSKFTDLDNGLTDAVTVGLLIGDIFLTQYGKMPSLYIAALVIKIGLKNICHG